MRKIVRLTERDLSRLVKRIVRESEEMDETTDMRKEFWKDQGFKTKEEYNQFMKKKIEELFKMIKEDPKLLAVFKRLAKT